MMTAEERVLNCAMNEIEQAKRDVDEEYDSRMDECYKIACENGQEIEQVVNNALLYDNLYRAVDETIEYWVKRLEAQGASVETIREIDPGYEPETEYTGDGGGYIAEI